MCGITGFYGFEDKELLKDMTKVIAHRGPDQFGYYSDSLVSLGHRRLSIVDLSENGKQPMHNEDNSVWVIYNGEIYNFKEIKNELEEKGHRFYSNSDTEVIVHAYEEYGENCVKLFNGCFGFAVWDSNKKKLFLARDRLGIKPLYYCNDNGKFLFSSEIKSILQCKEVKREINYQAADNYLNLRFVPGPETIFRNIYSLQPGHTMTIEGKNMSIKRYWQMVMRPEDKPVGYFIKRLQAELKKSVERRMMSDVPLGAFLSGGIDSSAVVAFMAKASDKPVNTYSVTFDLEQHKKELNYAKLIAETFNTNHKELNVKVDTAELLPQIIWNFDQPIGDPALIPTYLLAKSIKQYATVVLTGDGSDEIFAGYEHYKFMMLFEKYLKPVPKVISRKALPFIIGKTPMNLLNKFFEYSSSLGEEGLNRFTQIMKHLDERDKSFHNLYSVFTEDEKGQLYSTKEGIDVSQMRNNFKKYFNSGSDRESFLNEMLMYDIEVTLPDDFLMKVDRMTLANGVEGRVPFLDHTFVEFSGTIPPKYKMKGINEKYILKMAMKDVLPREIVKRRKERFFVPIDNWLTTDMKESAKRIIIGSQNPVFNRAYLQKMFDRYDSSKLYYGRQIWNTMCFEIWNKIYIEDENMQPRNIDKLFA